MCVPTPGELPWPSVTLRPLTGTPRGSRSAMDWHAIHLRRLKVGFLSPFSVESFLIVDWLYHHGARADGAWRPCARWLREIAAAIRMPARLARATSLRGRLASALRHNRHALRMLPENGIPRDPAHLFTFGQSEAISSAADSSSSTTTSFSSPPPPLLPSSSSCHRTASATFQ